MDDENANSELLCHLRSRGNLEVLVPPISLITGIQRSHETFSSLHIRFELNFKEAKVLCLQGVSDVSASMWIDYLSVRNLELVQNLQNPKSSQCLFGVLDHCQTPMGKRLLRANLLQPPAGAPECGGD
jgi:hypothetical protein